MHDWHISLHFQQTETLEIHLWISDDDQLHVDGGGKLQRSKQLPYMTWFEPIWIMEELTIAKCESSIKFNIHFQFPHQEDKIV